MGASGATNKRLNPYAPVFVPQASLLWENDVPPSFEAAKHLLTPSTVEDAAPEAATHLPLTDLPTEVLSSILTHVTEAADVASCARVCHRLHAAARQAPLRLRVRPPWSKGNWRRGMPTDADAPIISSAERTAMVLRGICTSFPGVSDLDLSMCPVGDAAVLRLVELLPALRYLRLAGCKKLTPAFTNGLLVQTDKAASGGAHRHRLKLLNLQRCFQLTAQSLQDVLMSASSGSPLRCVAMSHLELDLWPSPVSPMLGGQPSGMVLEAAGAGLRILTLYNCKGITQAGLQAITDACPRLELLLLGGSTLKPPSPADPGSIPAPTPHTRISFASLAQIVAGRRPCGPGPELQRQLAGWLADAALRLERLRALELTFFPLGVANLVQEKLEQACRDSSRPAPAVWDLTRTSCAAAAVSYLHKLPAGGGSGGGDDTRGEVSMALSAAANCSSQLTPLHVAAEEGGSEHVEALLALGAEVDARDRAGATPLFAAAEHGRPAAAAALLAGGADARISNSRGEAALYIAALRGHGAVVDLLLRHFKEQGLPWQDSKLYGDGWTPLMACAVADRQAIAQAILAAAGPSGAPALVTARNRYGQTALHVAARRGVLPLIQALLQASSGAVAGFPDKAGETPIAISLKHGHYEAARMLSNALRLANSQQPSPTQPFGSSPSSNPTEVAGGGVGSPGVQLGVSTPCQSQEAPPGRPPRARTARKPRLHGR